MHNVSPPAPNPQPASHISTCDRVVPTHACVCAGDRGREELGGGRGWGAPGGPLGVVAAGIHRSLSSL